MKRFRDPMAMVSVYSGNSELGGPKLIVSLPYTEFHAGCRACRKPLMLHSEGCFVSEMAGSMIRCKLREAPHNLLKPCKAFQNAKGLGHCKALRITAWIARWHVCKYIYFPFMLICYSCSISLFLQHGSSYMG